MLTKSENHNMYYAIVVPVFYDASSNKQQIFVKNHRHQEYKSEFSDNNQFLLQMETDLRLLAESFIE